jgi:iron complex outermembrane receptor protein
MAMPAWAQQQGTEGEKMQRVEVTGSSVKRADSETALPVQMISKQDIQRIGATSTESLLASIASLSSAGATSSAAGASSGTSGLASISLRGLGASARWCWSTAAGWRRLPAAAAPRSTST